MKETMQRYEKGAYDASTARNEIVRRFFLAIEILKLSKQIRGEKTLCDRYGINRRNLYQLRQDFTRGIFRVEWLTFLCHDFGISADWLLNGQGEFQHKNSEKTRKKEISFSNPLTDSTLQPV